jgi:hypothetical protein
MIDRQKGFGFVVISNLQSGANDLLVRDLQNILQDKMVPLPRPPDFKVSKMPAVRLKEYVGDYKFETFTNRIVLKGNQLVSGDYKIFPIGDDRFYRFADYATLTFIRNPDGTIKGLEWQGINSKVIGTRQTRTAETSLVDQGLPFDGGSVGYVDPLEPWIFMSGGRPL